MTYQACGDKQGTLTGGVRHKRAGQKNCATCRKAGNAYSREYRQKKAGTFKPKQIVDKDTWHTLSEIDKDARTGVCVKCGPTSLSTRLACPTRERSKKLGGLMITDVQYGEMLAEQAGGCAICHAPPPDYRRLNIDHCHKTGKLRKLLCFRCNVLLGKVDDDIELLEKAISYLKEFTE